MKSLAENEKGIALVAALIILLVLTMIGISSINTATFEANISGNQRIGAVAFYASEAGVQEGVRKLPDTSPILRSPLGSESFYWGGSREDKNSPKGPKGMGTMLKAGFESSWEFKRLQVNATGEALGAVKEVEVQVSFGPYTAGTQYN